MPLPTGKKKKRINRAPDIKDTAKTIEETDTTEGANTTEEISTVEPTNNIENASKPVEDTEDVEGTKGEEDSSKDKEEDIRAFSAKELIPTMQKSTRSQMSINLSTEIVNKVKTFTVEKKYENASAVIEKILKLTLFDQDIDMEKVAQYDEKYKKGKNPKKRKSKKAE